MIWWFKGKFKSVTDISISGDRLYEKFVWVKVNEKWGWPKIDWAMSID